MAMLDRLLSADGFTPHGVCLLWDPALIWLHLVADIAIAFAYLAIPAALAIVGRRRPDLNPFGVLYWFAAFIILCAATHLTNVVTLWQPWYVLSAMVKLLCAAVSVVTAALVWRILRFVLTVPAQAELEAANAELRRLNEELEDRVEERTRALSSANARLVAAIYEAREASRIKTDFMARMSHELRTPLNAIIGFCEMLLADIAGALRDKQRDYCRSIHDAAIQLLDQINDVLDVGRMEHGVDAPAPARQLLEVLLDDVLAQARPAAERAGVEVRCEAPRGLVVWADRRALMTILVNLISNAVKYSPKGANVLLSAETGTDGATIQVSDTGYGVGEESVSRVFEPFFRAHERELPAVGGSGLGLSLVKMLVDAHGGRLTFESRLNEGTTVTVWLPAEGRARRGDAVPGVLGPSAAGGFATGSMLARP